MSETRGSDAKGTARAGHRLSAGGCQPRRRGTGWDRGPRHLHPAAVPRAREARLENGGGASHLDPHRTMQYTFTLHPIIVMADDEAEAYELLRARLEEGEYDLDQDVREEGDE